MTALITAWGPLGVFVLMVPESACIPVPSEGTLMSAGFAVSQGWMPFWVAVLAATAGNLVGSLVAYGLGRAMAGRERQLPGGRVLAKCGGLFARHGSRAVFVARLMPLARTFVSLSAGHARMPLAPFALLTAAGSAIWAAAFVSLGLLAGASWVSLSSEIGRGLLVLTGVVLVVAFLAQHRAAAR